MRLNTTNGELIIGDLIISSELTEDQVINFPYKVSKGYHNGIYANYSVVGVDNDEFSLGFLFENGKLTISNINLGSIHGFEPFVISDQERGFLEEKLKQIGGNKSYAWGTVELSEDRKGGILSILVKYH